MGEQSVLGVASLWNMESFSCQYLKSESQNTGDKARKVPGHEDLVLRNRGKEPSLSYI